MKRSRPGRQRWSALVAATLGGILLASLPNPAFLAGTPSPTHPGYAPAPGQADPTANAGDANFAQVATATSAGNLGYVLAPTGGVDVATLPIFHPRQKQCVGTPPRQTEDPMSPPCVPLFVGDNGGATAPGVTRDTVTIELAVEQLEREIDLNEPWKPSDDARPGDPDYDPIWTANLVRTLKAHVRFFNLRYQTYGRQVRVRAVPAGRQDGDGVWSMGCADRKHRARETVGRQPFAVAYVGYWGGRCFRREVLTGGVPYFGMNYDVAREEYTRFDPLHWGFFPDQETGAALAGSFLCRTLNGSPARHSSDPLMQRQQRRFAFLFQEYWSDDNNLYGPQHAQVAAKIAADARARCDLPVQLVGYISEDIPSVAAQLKQDGITTILCRCPNHDVTYWTNQATALGWFPEWFWEQPMASALYARLLSDPKQRSFGIFPRWRHPAFRAQHHHQAFASVESASATPNTAFSADIYYTLHTLFSAIQTAGPTLSIENARLGLHTLRSNDPGNPWQPAGGWGPQGDPTAHTYVDSAAVWWWDPAGTPPGGTSADGCFRLSLGGRRSYAGEWPRSDSFLFDEGDACTGSDIEAADDF